MGQIISKFDPNLTQTPVIIPLLTGSREEMGDKYIKNQVEKQQTKVFGIQAPLISINNIVVDFDAVVDFSLKSIGPMPTISMTVRDRFGLIRSFDTPNSDNEIRVIIIPQFDNAYKNINLTFYIYNIKISQDVVSITGIFKLSAFTNTQFKAFGQMTTYQLIESIAKETGLGFASNVNDSNDLRYVYCDNKSYMELISKEIVHSGEVYKVYDWWVDMWNYLNFADIYERYNTIDREEDLKIWVSTHIENVTEDLDPTPSLTTALLTNHPVLGSSELRVQSLDIHNKTGIQLKQGTDKLYAVYSLNKQEYTDQLIQDSDVKRDVFERYEYLGEVYGDYDYLFAEKMRAAFIQKINSESIEVTLTTPMLGLMRGHKVNVAWYVNDSYYDIKINNLNKSQVLNDIQPEIPITSESTTDTDHFILDETVSGQYLITGCNIKFSRGKWEYTLTLNRPNKPKYLKENAN